MKTLTPELGALLHTSGAREFWMADCVEIATKFGLTLRYTTADVSIKLPETGDAVYRHDGARLTVGDPTQHLGLEVSDLDIGLAPIDGGGADDPGVTGAPLLDIPLVVAARNGLFDGATVTVWQALSPQPGPVYDPEFAAPNALQPLAPNASPGDRVLVYAPTGAVEIFFGAVTSLTCPNELLIQLKVKSAAHLLNAQFPRYVYRRGCVWDLYGQGCRVSRAAFTYSGTVQSNSSRTFIAATKGPSGPSLEDRPAGYFNEGVILFTSGRNAYWRVGVKEHQGAGNFVLARPLPHAPQPNDTFTVVPGCDKTLETCQDKFSNAARFRGFPFVPPPESIAGSKLKNVTRDKLRLPSAVT